VPRLPRRTSLADGISLLSLSRGPGVAAAGRWADRVRAVPLQGLRDGGHDLRPDAHSVDVWFRAMWLLTHQKNGASALSLQPQLGLTRYETAWTVLHKLRRAMVRPGLDRLRATVEVDETYVGGEEEGLRGRETYTKILVGVAAEEAGDGVGRIRLATLPDASGVSLLPFVEATVEPGSVVHTDGWEGYRGLLSAYGDRSGVLA
jgi:hypothetical protein